MGVPSCVRNASKPTAESIEREVRTNVLAQRVGGGTVADLDLSHEFVTRLTDRALRAAFVERFRVVVVGGGGKAEVIQRASPPGTAGPALNRVPMLARDGLIGVLCREVGRARFDHAAALRSLHNSGFPSDLLSMFRVPGSDRMTADDVARHVAARLTRGEPVRRIAQSLEFAPRATIPGFAATQDSGTDDFVLLRLQCPTHDRYLGPGDGSCPDLVHGVLNATPGVPAVVLAHGAVGDVRQGVQLIEHNPPATQWARDNALCGWAGDGPAHLLPRFPTYKEATSEFLPTDDLADVPMLGRCGVQARSPLLFQAGNIITYQDASGKVMLVGEAEVARNRALGLTTRQVVELFQAECGVDRVVELPAASYHIDQELSVRAGTDGCVAFVADVHAAVKLVIEASLPLLCGAERSGAVTAAMQAGRGREALALIWEGLEPHRTAEGGWPVEFATRLRKGPADNGVANFRRLLGALDELTATCFGPEELGDAFAQAFLRSLKRRARDRAAIRAALTGLGLRVVPMPAMPDDGRGANPLNMVHAPGYTLMPMVGGVLEPFDRAAASTVLGCVATDVQVRLIPSGETQCRDGGVRCSVGVYGRPSGGL